jgi:hypothetical protein
LAHLVQARSTVDATALFGGVATANRVVQVLPYPFISDPPQPVRIRPYRMSVTLENQTIALNVAGDVDVMVTPNPVNFNLAFPDGSGSTDVARLTDAQFQSVQAWTKSDKNAYHFTWSRVKRLHHVLPPSSHTAFADYHEYQETATCLVSSTQAPFTLGGWYTINRQSTLGPAALSTLAEFDTEVIMCQYVAVLTAGAADQTIRVTLNCQDGGRYVPGSFHSSQARLAPVTTEQTRQTYSASLHKAHQYISQPALMDWTGDPTLG